MSNANIVEKFLHPIVIRDIKNTILNDRKITWTYLQNTTINSDADRQYKANDSDIVCKNFGSITHTLININNHTGEILTSDIYNLFPDLKKIVETKFNIKVKKILKARINCVFPIGETTTKYDTPHTDHPKNNEKVKTIICYITNSDGDTVLFDEFDSGNIINSSKKTLIERFSPKEGKAIMFDSSRYHAMCFPSNNLRMVLAIILVVDDTR